MEKWFQDGKTLPKKKKKGHKLIIEYGVISNGDLIILPETPKKIDDKECT